MKYLRARARVIKRTCPWWKLGRKPIHSNVSECYLSVLRKEDGGEFCVCGVDGHGLVGLSVANILLYLILLREP